jgi:16S rRNA (cytosine1402-N4)-methyltransferase
MITRKPITASDGEVRANPRARSAKLRAAARLGAPLD